MASSGMTGAATFSFKQFLNYHHEAEWTSFHTHYYYYYYYYYYYSENLVAPGIEPGTSGSVVRNSEN
jgi:hypothetical protein